jgi:hypothetical protein
MMSEGPREGEAQIPFLARSRRFADCMILAWQEVEDKVDQMTVQEFGLFYVPEKRDPRVDLLRDNIGFQQKLKFLRTRIRFSRNDIKTIQEFAQERHKLVHGNIFTSRHPVAVNEQEKTRLMDLALRASQISTNRVFRVWVDEGTGDAGNKNEPHPTGRNTGPGQISY